MRGARVVADPPETVAQRVIARVRASLPLAVTLTEATHAGAVLCAWELACGFDGEARRAPKLLVRVARVADRLAAATFGVLRATAVAATETDGGALVALFDTVP